MSDSRGYDEQFNDGIFRASLNQSRKIQPQMWPKSVTEMRKNIDTVDQALTTQTVDHSKYMMPTKASAHVKVTGPWRWREQNQA